MGALAIPALVQEDFSSVLGWETGCHARDRSLRCIGTSGHATKNMELLEPEKDIRCQPLASRVQQNRRR
jgi:hypothetical protein